MSEPPSLRGQTLWAIRRADWSAAARLGARWSETEPHVAAAPYWTGYALLRSARAAAAERAFERALELDAGHAPAMAMLCRARLVSGRMGGLLELAQRCEGLDSAEPECWDALGVVYGQLGDYAGAVRVLERLLPLRPESARARYNLASMLNFCHRVDEAEQRYREALELDPRKFIAYWSLVQLRTQTRDRNPVEWLRERRNTFVGESGAEIYLSMALAKCHEDLGEPDEAFAALDRGNAAKRATLRYDIARDAALFAAIRARFDADFITGRRHGFSSEEPVFVVGMPRTGTTLLEQILGADRRVFAAGELQHFAAEWNRLATEAGMANLSPLTLVEGAAAVDPAALGEAYLRSTRPRTGHTPRFVDKLPLNFLNLGMIARALPGARILHLVRDPVDTCFANLKQLYGRDACAWSYRQDELAAYYRLYRELMAHWHRVLPGRILDVRYESLVTNTEAEARRVFAHLGLDFDPACLRFHERPGAVGTASTAQVRQPVHARSIGRWQMFGQHLGPLLQALGPLATEERAAPGALPPDQKR